MTAAELEAVVKRSTGERATTAYAALTLRRVLDSGKPLTDRSATELRLSELLAALTVNYFCLDVSGSMDTVAIRMAADFMASRAKPGDFALLFDCEVIGVWPVETVHGAIETLHTGPHRGGGGTDATSAIQTVREHAHRSGHDARATLLSDGMLPREQIALFDEFIEIAP